MVDTELITENVRVIEQNNPNEPLLLGEDDTLVAITEAVATALANHTGRAEDLSDQLFIESASGNGLARLAAVVDVFRRSGQGDGALRVRTRGGYARATSDTTIEDFATLSKIVLGANSDDISVEEPKSDEPIVVLRTNATLIDDSPLTATELTTELSQSVAAGHAVKIVAEGTFRLDGPDYTPPDGSGLNDGTISGEI